MQISERLYLVGSEQFGLSHMLDCNCYLIDCGSSAVLIDAGLGLGVDAIFANAESHGIAPRSISHVILTHAHLGHWGGASLVRERSGAQVWAPKVGSARMEHPEEDRTISQNLQHGRWPAELKPQACTPDVCFEDGDELTIGDVTLRMINVQGHTLDSTCILWENRGNKNGNRRALFTGDVLFYGGALGLINAEGSSLADYRRDLPKLADLRVDMLCPGHSVFVLSHGQKHIDRALKKLEDFVLPESFFEPNEFMWQTDYRSSLE